MRPTGTGRVPVTKAMGLAALLLLSPSNLRLNAIRAAEARAASASEKTNGVDHEARVNHAMELLGERAAERAGVASSGIAENLENYIQNHVDSSLRGANKPDAAEISRAILREAARQGMDPLFVMSIVAQESCFDTHALGQHGEIGLMQINPSTAEWIARRYGVIWRGAGSLRDPATNIRLGTLYFAWLRDSFRRRPAAYVAAYNMGPSAVRRRLAENAVPSLYMNDVMKKYRGYYRKLASADARRELKMSVAESGSKRACDPGFPGAEALKFLGFGC